METRNYSARIRALREMLHSGAIEEMVRCLSVSRDDLIQSYPAIHRAIGSGRFATVFDVEHAGVPCAFRLTKYTERSSINEILANILIEMMSVPSPANEGLPIVPSIGLQDMCKIQKIPICLGWMNVHNELGRGRNTNSRLTTIYEEHSLLIQVYRKNEEFNPAHDAREEDGFASLRSILFQMIWFLFAVSRVLHFSDIDRHDGNFMWIDASYMGIDDDVADVYYTFGDATWKLNLNATGRKLLVATDFGLSVCCDIASDPINQNIFNHFAAQKGVGHEEARWRWSSVYGDMLAIMFRGYEVISTKHKFYADEDGKITETQDSIDFRDLFDHIGVSMEDFTKKYTYREALGHPFFAPLLTQDTTPRGRTFKIPRDLKLREYRVWLMGN